MRQRHATSSTWALHTRLTLDEVNLHLAALDAAGLLGVVEAAGTATVYLPQRSADLPIDGTWEEIAEQDWNAVWKAGIAPIRVGDIEVVAPWLEPSGYPVTLVIEPGQAFGTGHHETTVACLDALQHTALTGASVLDVGTGTGVLALAAKALGARRVVATDTDPLAVAAAQDNAARNGLVIAVRRGSVEDGDGPFDVVVANLDTATLSALADELARAVAPAGTLIASGVSNERVHEAVTALHAAGLDVQATAGREWALLRGQH